MNSMADYYNILGVSKTASQDEIKRAYKKLAVSNHPDKGGDEKKFQEISNAYDVLSDPQKRQDYDNGGSGNRMNGHHPSPDDIFAHFFGGGRMPNRQNGSPNVPVKCSDVLKNYTISLQDAYKGVKRTLKIKLKGYKHDKMKKCDKCNGIGRLKNIKSMGMFTQVFESQCGNCKGSGLECPNDAVYEFEKNVTLNIPSGVMNGHKIVIDECGEQPKQKKTKPGNLVFNIEIAPNDVFVRKDNDLYASVSIDFVGSITGANIKFNILDEDSFEFNTKQFNIVYPNKKYQFKGKGMPIQNRSNQRGDLYLEFNIDYPILNDEQRYNLRNALINICNVEN